LGKLAAQKGANVIIVARNVEKLQAAQEYIEVRPVPIQLFQITHI
jgi:short-subunit dehydrogenase